MAALTSSPSGFSYAQAARGQASTAPSQTPSSKVTSGTATPATGTFSELGAGSNWADDVEATTEDKTTESRRDTQEQSKPQQVKDVMVERTKSESRIPNGTSGVSSPDLTASPSTTTNADEASAAPNGATPSESTWEVKSHASEPAWIAERKERQSGAHHDDNAQTGKGRRGKREPKEPKEGKEPKEPAQPETPPTPIKLQDAPPPAVNPWAKRMEVAKAKVPSPTPAAETPVVNENQRPNADARKKSNSVAAIPADVRPAGGEPKKAGGASGKRTDDARNSDRPRSKQGPEESAGPTKAPAQQHHSLPNLTAAPPPVKDEGSWPTPESAQEKERKESVVEKQSKDAKEADDSTDAESSLGAKRHQKPTWTPMPVTPTIVWQTEEMNRPRGGGGGDRGGRGGNSSRARGGMRGGANGTKGGDRGSGRPGPLVETDANGTVPRGRSSTLDREAMPPPPKPSHKASASGSRNGRHSRDHSSNNRLDQVKASATDAHPAEAAPVCASPSVLDDRRTKSPSKQEHNDVQDIKIPEPIPRENSTAYQADESREGSESARENSSARRAPFESKKESRSFDNYSGSKEWNGTPRGGKRGGRGRGGSREFANGHQASQAYTNGHADFSAYGVPPSPSGYQTPRGQYNYSQQGRGSWPRNNPRSQSIPIDNVYGGGSRPYWNQHPPHIQTGYYPGVYEYSGMPMTAMPYNPVFDHQYLMDMVSTQLEYYFSLDNLLKDMFLRKHMDSQGFVFIDVIAGFNRVKQLTTDKDLIKACCLRSESIEIRVGEDGKERLRRHEGWEQFLLPKEQRAASAQNDGPSVLQQPEPPQLQQFFMPPVPFRGPPSAGLPGAQRRSYDSGFPVNGSMASFAPFSPLAEAPYGEYAGGEEIRGRAAKSPMRESNGSPGHSLMGLAAGKDGEPDDFADEHASTLTVVVKPQTQKPSQTPHAASRTFSNGSIDTRSIYNEMEKPTENHTQPTTNGEPLVNGDAGKQTAPRHPSPSHSRSPDKSTPQSELSLFWVKDKDLPQNKIPEESTLEPYHQLRHKALSQRDQAATGTCPYDLDVLYQFWSHFLIRNFNSRMYKEFKYFAHDDAQQRHSPVGLHNLVMFYAKALASSSSIRDSIVSDYVELVKSEPPILKNKALHELRKAWRNGALNLKNRKKLADVLDEQTRSALES